MVNRSSRCKQIKPVGVAGRLLVIEREYKRKWYGVSWAAAGYVGDGRAMKSVMSAFRLQFPNEKFRIMEYIRKAR